MCLFVTLAVAVVLDRGSEQERGARKKPSEVADRITGASIKTGELLKRRHALTNNNILRREQRRKVTVKVKLAP